MSCWECAGCIITVIAILGCKTLADGDVVEISRINSHKYLNMLQHNILEEYLKKILERYLNISTRCNITSREDEHEDEVNVDNRIKVIIVVVTSLKSSTIGTLTFFITGLQVVMSSIAKAIGPLVSIFCGIIIISALFILSYDWVSLSFLLRSTSLSSFSLPSSSLRSWASSSMQEP